MKIRFSIPVLLSIALGLVSCNEDILSPVNTVRYTEPQIPFYEQMLLNGPVSMVKDSIVSIVSSDGRKYIEVEILKFNEDKKVYFHSLDGTEYGTDMLSSCAAFTASHRSFAFFEYPSKWWSVNRVTEESDMFRYEAEWDESGRYSKMRFYSESGPLCPAELEGEYELEKFLYDENGYPWYTFALDKRADGLLHVAAENRYEEPDMYGNPTKITWTNINGQTTIYRTIRY